MMASEKVMWNQVEVRFNSEQISPEIVAEVVERVNKYYPNATGNIPNDMFVACAADDPSRELVLGVAQQGQPGLFEITVNFIPSKIKQAFADALLDVAEFLQDYAAGKTKIR